MPTRDTHAYSDRGHEVVGIFASPGNAERVRALGAEPITLDVLDAGAVREAVLENEPDAIVHQATALANAKFSRNFDKTGARTNELRTTGADPDLARAAGRRRGRRSDEHRGAGRLEREGQA